MWKKEAYLMEFALLLVVVDDGLGGFVEGLQSLLDCLKIVVHSTTCLRSLHQALRHRFVTHFEVDDTFDWRNL